MKQVMDGMFRLYEIAADYKLRKVQKRIARRMRSVKRELTIVIGGKKSHPLRKRVDKYLTKMLK